MEHHETQEGWFTDPFGRHEARWFSVGTPTKLVRDGEAESYDDPPDEEWSSTPEPYEPFVAGNGGADLIRSGDQSGGADDLGSLNQRMSDGALEGGAHPEARI